MNKIPASSSEFPSEWYAMADADHFWMRWRFDVLSQFLKRWRIPLNARSLALDVGAGTGTLRTQLETKTSWLIDALERNPQALRHMKHSEGRTHSFDIESPPQELVSHYDHVTLFDVLEHVADPRGFSRAAVKLLKPGGYLWINVPAIQKLFSEYDRAAGHLRRYDKQTLAAELNSCPIKILDIRYWGFSLLPWLAARKLMIREGHVLHRGFQPPGGAARLLFNIQRLAETAVLRRPPLGTSLMLLARKI